LSATTGNAGDRLACGVIGGKYCVNISSWFFFYWWRFPFPPCSYQINANGVKLNNTIKL
jgi:hypothetical protein